MIEIGTVLQERYLIEKQIGVGGMGAVYLAVDQRFESYVAIKQTFYSNDELGEAFEREARLLNSLLHPALPHVSDYFTEGGGHFLVMQYIEGEDLFEILKRDGAFAVRDVLRWMDSLLDALDYLHSQEPPIIHRDIKPHNLKITPRGDIILLDFGLAKLKSDNTTGIKSVFGYSRKYSPLEQIQGTGTDARSDLFALAATAYHLLTGKPPIDVLARASEIIVANPDPLPLVSDINKEVPVSVANILNSAMALNAAGRFITAKAMRHALENAANEPQDENTVVVPEQILSVAAPENALVISPETEDFPALEAFAADAANVSLQSPAANLSSAVDVSSQAFESPQEIENEELIAADDISIPQVEQMPIPPVEYVSVPHTVAESSVQQAAPPQRIVIADAETKVSVRRRRSPYSLAALALLIIFAGLATGYFINQVSSSNESPAVQTTVEPNPNIEQPEIVSDSPVSETLDSPALKNQEQARTKPVSVEKTSVKKPAADETVSKTETTEKPNPPTAQPEPERPAVQAPRRSEPPRRNNNNQPSPRAEQQPVPDIESVFTGRPSWQRNARMRRQEERRRQEEDMSEEEFREMRRQRRKERWRRQNRDNFPF
jgi:serine/threonine protein kinase